MTNDEYAIVQNSLLEAAEIISRLDLNKFIGRATESNSIGAILDPTLYRQSRRTLDAIINLASEAIRVKAAYERLKNTADFFTRAREYNP